jgi:signal transduction histidine kinase
MRNTTAQDRAGYPGSVEGVYARLRRHPLVVDGALAAVLLAGSANALGRLPVLPASLALVGTVVVRRRFPVGAYVTALAIGVAQVVFGIGSTFTDSPLQPTFADLSILLLLYTLAVERPRRISLLGLAACVALFAAAIARYNPGGDRRHWLVFILVTGLFYLLAPLSAWVLGDSMRYRRAYSDALEERAVRAERERDAQAQIAAAAERARIARELHDVIAHNLSVMVAQADGGTYAFDAAPEKSRQALAEIGRTGRQALSEMSSLLGVLRTGPEAAGPQAAGPQAAGPGAAGPGAAGSEAAPLAPAPAATEIGQLVTQAREAGMRVSDTVEGAVRPLPAGLSLAAYRIVQEALTNVRKHAGPEAAAEVTLRYGPDELLVRVADDGRGTGTAGLPRYGAAATAATTAKDPGGHGLTGMRERAAMYGGTLQAGPRPGGGFEVTARLPLPAAEPAAGRRSRGAA